MTSHQRRGMRRRRSAAMIGLATVSALAWGCGAGEVEPVQTIRSVRYAHVFAAGSDRLRTFAGTAQAASQQNLSFRVGGTVTNVAVEVGRVVERGELLAQLDAGDYLLKRQQADASLAQARAESRNANASYERTLALFENQNASRSDVDAGRAQFESANASVTSAETARRLAQQEVNYTRLLAPTAGSISRVDVEANETVSPGATVVVLETEGLPEVEVAVPGIFIGAIQPRTQVEVTFGAIPNRTFAATITEVGVATSGAGTFPVVGQLNEDAPAVRPGMAAQVTFSIGAAADAARSDMVIVPSQAVGQDDRGRFVFVLVPGTGDLATAERRAVTIDALTPAGLEVTSGLADGELVATAGLRSLSHGLQVRLLEAR